MLKFDSFDLMIYIFIYIIIYRALRMKSILIQLPDKMAKASQQVAKKMGISRTEFVRQAISHELRHYKAQNAINQMAEAFKVMEQSAEYLVEANQLESELEENLLLDEEEKWWDD